MRRSNSKRSLRLGDQIMREVADILSSEISDPRLTLVTISGARMNADLHVAEILYTVGGDAERRDEVAQAFEHCKGFLRKQLAVRLRTKMMPDLRFCPDEFLEDMVYVRPQTAGPGHSQD